MTTQATRALVTLLAALFFDLLTRPAFAASVSGRIEFLGRTVPTAVLYARDVDTGTMTRLAIRRGQADFTLELPHGRYWIFLQPDEPGLIDLYGAHTLFSLCRREHTGDVEAQCTEHGLVAVEVRGSPLGGIDIDDWMLNEDTAAELDRVLGTPAQADSGELGRPRFSEYRVQPVTARAAALVIDGGQAEAARAELEAAAAAGSNFAGGFALTALACGENCEAFAVIDLASGTVTFPEPLTHVQRTLPCHSERVLAFRDDSRLLEYTQLAGEVIVTDYLLWDATQHQFTQLAQYRRSRERFCAPGTAEP